MTCDVVQGIYLKFRGSGLVTDVTYENIVMDEPQQWVRGPRVPHLCAVAQTAAAASAHGIQPPHLAAGSILA